MEYSPISVFVPELPSVTKISKFLRISESSRHWSNFGPLVSTLESNVAERFNLEPDNIATCTNATLALEGALVTSGFRDRSWVAPSWTYTATASALQRSVSEFIFNDIDESERVVASATDKFLLDVLPFGARSNSVRWHSDLETVVVDAAASFGSLGPSSFLTPVRSSFVVSLHATKILPAGEGALVISKDKNWISEFKKWTNFGMWGSRVSKVEGTNAKMSELPAAVALAALEEWEDTKIRWIELTEKARQVSAENGFTTASSMSESDFSPYWNLRLENSHAVDSLQEHLTNLGIQSRRWWEFGCHEMPAYATVRTQGPLIRTSEIASKTLGIPLFLGMTKGDWARIDSALCEFHKK